MVDAWSLPIVAEGEGWSYRRDGDRALFMVSAGGNTRCVPFIGELGDRIKTNGVACLRNDSDGNAPALAAVDGLEAYLRG